MQHKGETGINTRILKTAITLFLCFYRTASQTNILTYFATSLGWAHKATLALRPFLMHCAPPSDF
jgi:hypothetical protein